MSQSHQQSDKKPAAVKADVLSVIEQTRQTLKGSTPPPGLGQWAANPVVQKYGEAATDIPHEADRGGIDAFSSSFWNPQEDPLDWNDLTEKRHNLLSWAILVGVVEQSGPAVRSWYFGDGHDPRPRLGDVGPRPVRERLWPDLWDEPTLGFWCRLAAVLLITESGRVRIREMLEPLKLPNATKRSAPNGAGAAETAMPPQAVLALADLNHGLAPPFQVRSDNPADQQLASRFLANLQSPNPTKPHAPNGAGAAEMAMPPEELVTLDQCAALVSTSKRTLERAMQNGKIPRPDYPGGGGKANRWEWSTIRPALMEHYRASLPERFPSSRFV